MLLLPLVAQMLVKPWLVVVAPQLMPQLLLLGLTPAWEVLPKPLKPFKLPLLLPPLAPGAAAPPQLRPVRQLLLLGDCMLLMLPPACMLRRSLLVLW
jgi:hypothetical protein